VIKDQKIDIVGLVGGGTLAMIFGALLVVTDVRWLATGILIVGSIALIPGLLGLRYVKHGKFIHRDRLLTTTQWQGNEVTLDVGTGGGLLLIGAAKLSPRGKAYGIDIWSAADLSNNSLSRALTNGVLEGVADRIEIRSEDARKMSFADQTFDRVVSMLCIHNIADKDGQDQALYEMVRVCKDDGWIVISDLANTQRYADLLKKVGLVVAITGLYVDTFPLQRIVIAQKRPVISP
jgi:arsenite methyltransferase